jgi:hypothetical protein
MEQSPDQYDNSAAIRASAEDDMVRAMVDRALITGKSTDKFSGWLLAAAGGFIGLQFTVSKEVAVHAPILMLTAISITVVSLFIGAMVRLMTYNIGHAMVMWGVDKQGEEIKLRYLNEMTEQGRYLQSIGKPAPPLGSFDIERINRNVTALVDHKQRWLPNVIFEACDSMVGWMAPKAVPDGAVDKVFEGLDRPARLATAAQYWAVVQLLVLIVAAAAGAAAYTVAVLCL